VRTGIASGFAVAVKLDAADLHKSGIPPADCRQLVYWLNVLGVDLLELAGGSSERPWSFDIFVNKGGQETSRPGMDAGANDLTEYAVAARVAAAMPLMLTGGFRSRADILAVLENGSCDMVGLGRLLCVDSRFVQRLKKGTAVTAEEPVPAPQWWPETIPKCNMSARRAWYCIQLYRIGAGLEPNWCL